MSKYVDIQWALAAVASARAARENFILITAGIVQDNLCTEKENKRYQISRIENDMKATRREEATRLLYKIRTPFRHVSCRLFFRCPRLHDSAS